MSMNAMLDDMTPVRAAELDGYGSAPAPELTRCVKPFAEGRSFTCVGGAIFDADAR